MKMDTFIKTRFDKIYNDHVLRKEMSPGSWIDDVSYMPIVRMHMTCGGGVGGSTWFEYIKRESFYLAGSPLIISVQTWDNKSISLNTSYMVKADYLTIATASFLSQNPNYPIGIYVFNYLVEDGHKLTLSNECRPVIW